MSRWLALLVFALSALVVGCGAPMPEASSPAPLEFNGSLVIEAGFSAAERIELDAAFAEWQFATGGSYEYTARRSPDSPPWVVKREGGSFLGQADPVARVIRMNADGITPPDGQPFRAEAFRHVALHEMGHAAGLLKRALPTLDEGGHIAGTVMDAHAELGCIDPVALDALCSLRGCAEQHPTCTD
jgi:hypothetical protein